MMSGSEAVLYAEAFDTVIMAIFPYCYLILMIWIIKKFIPVFIKSIGDALFDHRLEVMEAKISKLEKEEVDEQ